MTTKQSLLLSAALLFNSAALTDAAAATGSPSDELAQKYQDYVSNPKKSYMDFTEFAKNELDKALISGDTDEASRLLEEGIVPDSVSLGKAIEGNASPAILRALINDFDIPAHDPNLLEASIISGNFAAYDLLTEAGNSVSPLDPDKNYIDIAAGTGSWEMYERVKRSYNTQDFKVDTTQSIIFSREKFLRYFKKGIVDPSIMTKMIDALYRDGQDFNAPDISEIQASFKIYLEACKKKSFEKDCDALSVATEEINNRLQAALDGTLEIQPQNESRLSEDFAGALNRQFPGQKWEARAIDCDIFPGEENIKGASAFLVHPLTGWEVQTGVRTEFSNIPGMDRIMSCKEGGRWVIGVPEPELNTYALEYPTNFKNLMERVQSAFEEDAPNVRRSFAMPPKL